jgi:hypothetical protein
MPNIREKLASGKEKLSSKLQSGKEKLRTGKARLGVRARVVASRIREEGPRGARRAVWFLLAAALYYQGW